MINSKNNEKVKFISKLQNKKYRDEEEMFIAEGSNLVKEAKKYGDVVEVYEVGVDVTQDVMDKMASFKGCNILALCKKIENRKINDKILILDNIQDPGNLGTLLRSAVSFGFETVVLDNTVDPYNPKCVRGSEGAIFKVNMYFNDTLEFIESLK